MQKEKAIKLTSAEQKLLDSLEVGTQSETVFNPLSGAREILEPQAVALYDFIKGLELMIHQGKIKDIRTFDRARYLFLKLYPDAYMNLLD